MQVYLKIGTIFLKSSLSYNIHVTTEKTRLIQNIESKTEREN